MVDAGHLSASCCVFHSKYHPTQLSRIQTIARDVGDILFFVLAFVMKLWVHRVCVYVWERERERFRG